MANRAQPMRQVLIALDSTMAGTPKRSWSDGWSWSVPAAEKPDRVWSLCVADTPKLPFVPVHWQNAMLEDEGHDWSWSGGILRIYNRRQKWLLLEYKQ